MKTKKMAEYISDISEAQDWSQDMGQVQVLEAGEKDKKDNSEMEQLANQIKLETKKVGNQDSEYYKDYNK